MPPPPPPQAAPRVTGTDDNPDGIAAYGTLVQVQSSGPGVTPVTFETIAGVGDITGPANSIAEVDVTSHSSGAPIKRTLPGLIDLGDLSFPCFWNPDDPTQAYSSSFGAEYLFYNRVVTQFRLVMPNESHRTRQFKGFYKSMGEDYKLAGVCTRNMAIRITSPMQDVASPISLTPTKLDATAAGAPSTTVQVAAGGSAAPWQAIPDVPWITITEPTAMQQGDGEIDFAVAAQGPTPVARVGHINVTGLNLVFTVNQAVS